MKVTYSKEDQKALDLSSSNLQDYSKLLLSSLKKEFGDNRELISKAFNGDKVRYNLLMSHTKLMQVIIPIKITFEV